jgi:hypothetical protein
MADPSDPVSADGPADQPADDDVFAELVARFHDEPDARVWPDAENLGGQREPGPEAPDGAGDERPGDGIDRAGGRTLFVVGPPGDLVGDGRWAPDVPGEVTGAGTGGEDDHYVAPPPPRVPWPRPLTVVSIASIALGIVVLAVPGLVARATSTAIQEILGVMLILGGVGALVARMGDRPPTDDDNWPDDGAVL